MTSLSIVVLFLCMCAQLHRAFDFAHVLMQDHACGDHRSQVPLLSKAIHLTFRDMTFYCLHAHCVSFLEWLGRYWWNSADSVSSVLEFQHTKFFHTDCEDQTWDRLGMWCALCWLSPQPHVSIDDNPLWLAIIKCLPINWGHVHGREERVSTWVLTLH